MRFVRESSSLIRWLALAAAFLAAAGLAVARWIPAAADLLPSCRWRRLTGLACPTCGMTTALAALAQGRWSEAWHAHPLVPAGVVLAALAAAWALAAMAWPALRVQPALGPRETKAARVVAASALLLLWLRQALVLR